MGSSASKTSAAATPTESALANDNGRFSGISVGYLDAIAKRFGLTVQYVPPTVGWPEAMRDVKEEHRLFDLLLTMQRTPEREKEFALTSDYLRMPWALFARRDAPFLSGLDDLKGKTVASERSYVMTGRLRAEHPEIMILEVALPEDALRARGHGPGRRLRGATWSTPVS